MTLLVVGVAVPTPGAVGGFHEAYRIARRPRSSTRRTTRRSARRSCCTPCRSCRSRCWASSSWPGGADAGPHAAPGRASRRRRRRQVKCPYCGHLGDKVVDSRESKEGEVIRRRRECLDCGRRFTSYERIDEIPYMVVKKDGSRERFERQKLIGGHAEGLREAAGERGGAREGGGPGRGDAAGAAREGDRDGGDRPLRDAGAEGPRRGGLRALRVGLPQLPRRRRVQEAARGAAEREANEREGHRRRRVVAAIVAGSRPAAPPAPARRRPHRGAATSRRSLAKDGRVFVSFTLDSQADRPSCGTRSAAACRRPSPTRWSCGAPRPLWFDRTIARAPVTASARFDNLTRQHQLLADDRRPRRGAADDRGRGRGPRLADRVQAAAAVRRPRALEPNAEYYVRVRAQTRPRVNWLLFWPWEQDARPATPGSRSSSDRDRDQEPVRLTRAPFAHADIVRLAP